MEAFYLQLNKFETKSQFSINFTSYVKHLKPGLSYDVRQALVKQRFDHSNLIIRPQA